MSGERGIHRQRTELLSSFDPMVVKWEDGMVRWTEEPEGLRVQTAVLRCRTSKWYSREMLWIALKVRNRNQYNIQPGASQAAE